MPRQPHPGPVRPGPYPGAIPPTQEEMARVRAYFTWQADMRKVCDALEPFVGQMEGVTYVMPGAPEDLSRIYHKLVQTGYANGFFYTHKED